ncbi:MAG: ATPase [Bacteroidetes bacterium GWA2_30_7]|nr:MAG: ATPase [Bacteroidetes bacterium GWA2_30_7]
MKKTDDTIIVEQTFDSSIESVWDAITKPDKMKLWFFENITTFKAVVGFETRFVVQVEDRIFPHLWKLTEVVPNKKITYDWRYEGYSGSAIVSFELINQNNHTKLRLTDTIIENFPDNIPEFKRESGIEGWNYFIKKSLKEYLEKEKINHENTTKK